MKNSLDILKDILKDLKHTLSDKIMDSLFNICEQLYLSKNDEERKNILTKNKNELNRISKGIKKYLEKYLNLIDSKSHSPSKTKRNGESLTLNEKMLKIKTPNTKSNRMNMNGGDVHNDYHLQLFFVLLAIITMSIMSIINYVKNGNFNNIIFDRTFGNLYRGVVYLKEYIIRLKLQYNVQQRQYNEQQQQHNVQQQQYNVQQRQYNVRQRQFEREWRERQERNEQERIIANRQKQMDRQWEQELLERIQWADVMPMQEEITNEHLPVANIVPISINNARPISFPTTATSLLPIRPMNAIPDERNLEQESDRFHSQLQQLRETRHNMMQQMETLVNSLHDNNELIERLEFRMNSQNRRVLNVIKDQFLSIVRPSRVTRSRLEDAEETRTQTLSDLENTNTQFQRINREISTVENALNQIEGVAFEIVTAEGHPVSIFTLYPKLLNNHRRFRGGSRQSIKTDSKNSKVKRHGYCKTRRCSKMKFNFSRNVRN